MSVYANSDSEEYLHCFKMEDCGEALSSWVLY